MRDLHVISIGPQINWEFGLSMFGWNGTHLYTLQKVSSSVSCQVRMYKLKLPEEIFTQSFQFCEVVTLRPLSDQSSEVKCIRRSLFDKCTRNGKEINSEQKLAFFLRWQFVGFFWSCMYAPRWFGFVVTMKLLVLWNQDSPRCCDTGVIFAFLSIDINAVNQ